jgi:hypothetical protein
MKKRVFNPLFILKAESRDVGGLEHHNTHPWPPIWSLVTMCSSVVVVNRLIAHQQTTSMRFRVQSIIADHPCRGLKGVPHSSGRKTKDKRVDRQVSR